jgi:hypothetical protein
MNFNKTILLIALFSFWLGSVNAQTTEKTHTDENKETVEKNPEGNQKTEEKIIKKPKRKSEKINDIYDGYWSIGIGVNAVNDGGQQLKNFFNGENWNLSKPLVVNIEYYHNNMVSFALMASFNEYVAGKNIDDTSYIIKDFEASYMAFDFATKFYLRDFFRNMKFDPYGYLGFGYTNIGAYKSLPFENNDLQDDLDHIAIDDNGNYDVPAIGRITLNIGLGFNYWFTRKWALNFNMAGKFGIGSGDYKRGPNSISNQIQFSLGTHILLN